MLFRASEIVAALALFSTAVSATNVKNCVKKDVTLVKEKFEHPKIFCEWYIGSGRTVSPIRELNKDHFQHACACIVDKKASNAQIANIKKPKNAVKTCTNTAKHLFLTEVKEPKLVCDFWTAQEWRGKNPFPSMSGGVAQLYNACKCYEPVKKPVTTTTKKPATTTSKPKSATTTSKPKSATTTSKSATTTSKSATTTSKPKSATTTTKSATSTGKPASATTTMTTTTKPATTTSKSMDASAAYSQTALGFAHRYMQARHAAYRG